MNKSLKTIFKDRTLSGLRFSANKKSEWSFSREWDAHFNYKLGKTWGWTAKQRIEQFILEVDVNADWCRGKLFLDAGCGNGQFSECLTELGATVIGLDYSTSVFRAERNRRSPNVGFIQGDLQHPPFDRDTFDLIVANGVLHHTPSMFIEVAKLAKPGGRFYLWLYRKPGTFFRRYFLHLPIDVARIVVSRLPRGPQTLVVKAYALILILLHKIVRKRLDRSWQEEVVGAYDTLTPRWRHYHTPIEVSCWFFLNGYSSPTITHWDNLYGFGMVAQKRPQQDTPGMNFGKRDVVTRYSK
jgi:SAM-dependent methyltransferase